MILTCASCLTRYYADDAAIGLHGRSVRCAACGHTWFAEAALVLADDAAGAEKPDLLTRERVERMRHAAVQGGSLGPSREARGAAAAGPPQSAATRYRAQQSERMREARTRAVATAWAGTGAALAASAAGAVLFRQDVAEFWPKTASAYAAVGLDVNIYGLDVSELAVERVQEGATPVLLVSGEVRNIGRDAKAAPPLRLTLRDSHAKELYEVVYSVGPHPISPGGAMPFQFRVANPPVDAVDLEAAFATVAEAQTAMAAPPPPSLDPVDEDVLELGSDAALAAQEPASAGSQRGGLGGPEGAPQLRLDRSSFNEEHG
jgi:predicted Zn finger-like uncharacterized protein